MEGDTIQGFLIVRYRSNETWYGRRWSDGRLTIEYKTERALVRALRSGRVKIDVD